MNNNGKLIIMFAVILLVFGYYAYFSPKPQPQTAVAVDTAQAADTSEKIEPAMQNSIKPAEIISSDTTVYAFETDMYRGVVSSLSGGFSSFILSTFKTYNKEPLEMVPSGFKIMKMKIKSGSREYDFSNANFSLIYSGDIYPLKNDVDSLVIKAEIESVYVTRTFIFSRGSYLIKHRIASNIDIDNVVYVYENGISLTEKNVVDDIGYYSIDAFSQNNLVRLKHKSVKNEMSMSGNYSWMGLQTKYFFAGLIGDGMGFTAAPLTDTRSAGAFSFSSDTQTIYMGPIDYRILKGFKNGMDKIPDFGWSIIQPISRFILEFIHFCHKFISNYGVIIIIISIMLILIFSPLTIKSYSSLRKMQMIQPEIEKLKLKHAKDPQKLNTETMNLYKTSGVNPFTGCLPMFIQMPVFFALYAILRTTIELRYAPFIFWITDLSAKDPLFVLPILTGVTMFFSQKMSATDQTQKMLIYTMPIVLTFLFLSLPAGINLYWLVYNMLSVVQQIIIKRTLNKETGVQNG